MLLLKRPWLVVVIALAIATTIVSFCRAGLGSYAAKNFCILLLKVWLDFRSKSTSTFSKVASVMSASGQDDASPSSGMPENEVKGKESVQ